MFGIGRIKKYCHKIKLNYEINNEKAGLEKTVSVMDIITCNMNYGEWIRLDVVICYMTIVDYYNGKKDWHLLYDKMLKGGNPLRRFGDNKSFELFIESVEFDCRPQILLDKNLNIIDGVWELAVALYNGVEQVPVRIVGIDEKSDFSIHWLFANGFDDSEINAVNNKAEEILDTEKQKNSMIAVVWNTAAEFSHKIEKDILLLQKQNIVVRDVKAYKYNYRHDYENIVRNIYSVDDVEPWKIEKKIEHMKLYQPELLILDLEIDNPQFRIKGLSHMPTSKVGEQLKYAIRNKYQSKVEDYFFDIIFHVADNYTQSGYIKGIFNNHIEMIKILSILGKYEYAFVKTDTPGFPKNFPDAIPMGKDIDILVHKQDAEFICDEILSYFNDAVGDVFRIKTSKDFYSRAIRIEISERLIFQVDLIFNHPRLNEEYFTDALTKRISATEQGTYYVLPCEYEVLYRLAAFRENPKKKYHLQYIIENKGNYNNLSMRKYIRKDYWSLSFIMKYVECKR